MGLISIADPELEGSETFGQIRNRNKRFGSETGFEINVSGPGLEYRSETLFRFPIGSGSGQKFRILPDPDPVTDPQLVEILSYLVRLDGRPRSASGLGLLSKNVKYLLCTFRQKLLHYLKCLLRFYNIIL